MRISYGVHCAALAAAALLAWPGTASALSDLVLNVDCAAGQSIGQALARPTLFDRRLVIVVNGTCHENFTIARDDVVVRSTSGGVAGTDPSLPAIVVDGAKRVTLENLVVTGGHEGVRVTNGASATIRKSTISNAVQHGVLVNFGAYAKIEDSILESNSQFGIVVNASSASLVGSILRNNNGSGIAVVSTGYALLGQVDDAGNVCCGNTIEGNRLDGVTASRNAVARLYGNTIRNNGAATGRWGILSVEQSMVWLEGGNVVSGNGSASGGGGAFVRGSGLRTGQGDQPVIPQTNEISGNTTGILGQTANLELGGGVVVSGSTLDGIVADQGTRLRANTITVTQNLGNGILALKASGVQLNGSGPNNVVSQNGKAGLACDEYSHYSGNAFGIGSNNPAFGDVSCTPF